MRKAWMLSTDVFARRSVLTLRNDILHRPVIRQVVQFERRVAARLRDSAPRVAAMTPEALAQFVTATRQQAETLGFKAEQHLVDIIEAHFFTGPSLWTDPLFEAIVSAPLRTLEAKAQRIRRAFVHPHLPPAAREEATDE